MKSLVFVILGKWNYGFNVLYCYQFARHTNSSLINWLKWYSVTGIYYQKRRVCYER